METPASADVIRARIAVEVKVVDPQTAQVRWPSTGDSAPYEYETPYVRITPENSEASVRSTTIRQTATDIARWFYLWKPETMKEENPDVKIR
jgi:hypothetical protein